MTIAKDDIEDLKQFISATVSQQLAQQTGELREEMNKHFDEQDEKLDEILNAVGSSIHEVEQKVDNHETRLTRLERKLA